MADMVYFDTSVFLDILAAKPNSAQIETLLQELTASGSKIYTSILTQQEVQVRPYRRGQVARELHRMVARLAKIKSIDLDTALTAAKLEASIVDGAYETEDQRKDKRRRKWDCFHIATAMVLGCTAFYSTDERMRKVVTKIGPPGMKALSPTPKQGTLQLAAPVVKATSTTASS